MWTEASKIAAFLRARIPVLPQVGIMLGTGLGGLVNEMEHSAAFSYKEIPGFPVTSVEGHTGKLIFGKLGGKEVMAMQGRIHYYEGLSMQTIILPIRVMSLLGISLLILSNASGGLNPSYGIGDMMIVTDQINLMGTNPLIGSHDPRFGTRFPDMSHVFDKKIIQTAKLVAHTHQIPCQCGVLASVAGPIFETNAEYAYIRFLGADAVGMSIIPEAIAARQLNLRCFAISVISDLGIPGKIQEVSHEQVQEVASRAEPVMTILIEKMLELMD